MAKILVADDDLDIRKLLKVFLSNEGYDVDTVDNGEDAVTNCENGYDLIILDVTMPQKDGFQACEEIRTKTAIPILFLTAKGMEYDKIMGFSSGGDDYLVKPFIPSELVLRVKALLRRYLEYSPNIPAAKNSIIQVGDICIDEDFCKVTVCGEEKELTPTEFAIISLLCKTKGKVFSAQNIYESIWNEPYFYSANNTIMVHIRKLREKIEENPQTPKYIKTVWGMGYKIDGL